MPTPSLAMSHRRHFFRAFIPRFELDGHVADPQLPDRLPDLMFWLTLPFLGAEGAAAERDRVRQSMRKP